MGGRGSTSNNSRSIANATRAGANMTYEQERAFDNVRAMARLAEGGDELAGRQMQLLSVQRPTRASSYRGYNIETSTIPGRFSVEYEGEDVLFRSQDEARRFIDEVSRARR